MSIMFASPAPRHGMSQQPSLYVPSPHRDFSRAAGNENIAANFGDGNPAASLSRPGTQRPRTPPAVGAHSPSASFARARTLLASGYTQSPQQLEKPGFAGQSAHMRSVSEDTNSSSCSSSSFLHRQSSAGGLPRTTSLRSNNEDHLLLRGGSSFRLSDPALSLHSLGSSPSPAGDGADLSLKKRTQSSQQLRPRWVDVNTANSSSSCSSSSSFVMAPSASAGGISKCSSAPPVAILAPALKTTEMGPNKVTTVMLNDENSSEKPHAHRSHSHSVTQASAQVRWNLDPPSPSVSGKTSDPMAVGSTKPVARKAKQSPVVGPADIQRRVSAGEPDEATLLRQTARLRRLIEHQHQSISKFLSMESVEEVSFASSSGVGEDGALGFMVADDTSLDALSESPGKDARIQFLEHHLRDAEATIAHLRQLQLTPPENNSHAAVIAPQSQVISRASAVRSPNAGSPLPWAEPNATHSSYDEETQLRIRGLAKRVHSLYDLSLQGRIVADNPEHEASKKAVNQEDDDESAVYKCAFHKCPSWPLVVKKVPFSVGLTALAIASLLPSMNPNSSMGNIVPIYHSVAVETTEPAATSSKSLGLILPRFPVDLGHLLREWRRSNPTGHHSLPERFVLNCLLSILHALDTLHRHGVIHGDVRDEHVMVDLDPPLRTSDEQEMALPALLRQISKEPLALRFHLLALGHRLAVVHPCTAVCSAGSVAVATFANTEFDVFAAGLLAHSLCSRDPLPYDSHGNATDRNCPTTLGSPNSKPMTSTATTPTTPIADVNNIPLPAQYSPQLLCILKGLLHPNPSQRWTVSTAIQAVSTLLWGPTPQDLVPNGRTSSPCEVTTSPPLSSATPPRSSTTSPTNGTAMTSRLLTVDVVRNWLVENLSAPANNSQNRFFLAGRSRFLRETTPFALLRAMQLLANQTPCPDAENASSLKITPPQQSSSAIIAKLQETIQRQRSQILRLESDLVAATSATSTTRTSSQSSMALSSARSTTVTSATSSGPNAAMMPPPPPPSSHSRYLLRAAAPPSSSRSAQQHPPTSAPPAIGSPPQSARPASALGLTSGRQAPVPSRKPSSSSSVRRHIGLI